MRREAGGRRRVRRRRVGDARRTRDGCSARVARVREEARERCLLRRSRRRRGSAVASAERGCARRTAVLQRLAVTIAGGGCGVRVAVRESRSSGGAMRRLVVGRGAHAEVLTQGSRWRIATPPDGRRANWTAARRARVRRIRKYILLCEHFKQSNRLIIYL